MRSPSGSDVARRRSRLSLPLVLRKLGVAAGILVFAVIINFFLFRMLPGDPAKAFTPLWRDYDPGALREVRERMGLDEPLLVQFGKYVNRLGHIRAAPRWRMAPPRGLAWPTDAPPRSARCCRCTAATLLPACWPGTWVTA